MSSIALPPDAVDGGVLAVFAVVYVGMFLGGLPHVKLDRTGVALLGAIAMIAITGMSLEEAARSVDLPTIVLLFAFMVVSAQMRLGGFYTAVAQRVGALELPVPALLAVVLAVAAVLSAVFSNDVVCLTMTPVVARICLRRRIDPLPFLLGLACAANIGSAATLIGNPQNMLIGSMLELPFGRYLAMAWLPVAASLVPIWLWLVVAGKAGQPTAPEATAQAPIDAALQTTPAAYRDDHRDDQRGGGPGPRGDAPTLDEQPPFDPVQSAKGLLVATALFVVFLFTGLPREVAALIGAGVLLLSRRLHSAHVMGFVDWQLLLLFIGLFIVNHAIQATGLPTQAVAWLAAQGVHLGQPGTLLVVGAVLSNLVSNVPAVMLLLPHLEGAGRADAGVLLALASTFAGNLLMIGSIANLIVVDLAEKAGIAIDWKRHARVGVPVTLMSLAVLWGYWVALRPGA